MADREPRREDLQAALGARRELGPDYEDAVLDGFLERVDRSIDARVDRSIDARVDARVAEQSADRGIGLGMVSLGAGIPITAIASGQGLGGLLVAWGGIAAVNLASALGRRRRG